MPLVIGQIDVFHRADASIREALEAAASACAPGITWTPSAYEGVDLLGTRITLEGPALSMIWTPWVEDHPGRYSAVFIRDGSDWQLQLKDSVRQMISRSS